MSGATQVQFTVTRPPVTTTTATVIHTAPVSTHTAPEHQDGTPIAFLTATVLLAAVWRRFLLRHRSRW